MAINTIIGLISALIGSTATLLGAWAYIRSKHPTRKELLHGVAAVTVIMIAILGFAVAVSRATAVKVDNLATPTVTSTVVPSFLGPGAPYSTLTPTSTKVPTPISSPTSTSSSTPISSPTPTSLSTPTTSSTPESSSPPPASSTPPTDSSRPPSNH